MNFRHAPAGRLPETNLVQFGYWEGYDHLFTRSNYAWKLSEDVLNWLMLHAPGHRVLIDCGQEGAGEPQAHMTFQFKSQAEAFVKQWGSATE